MKGNFTAPEKTSRAGHKTTIQMPVAAQQIYEQ